jgi:hypothetical protein
LSYLAYLFFPGVSESQLRCSGGEGEGDNTPPIPFAFQIGSHAFTQVALNGHPPTYISCNWNYR